MSNVKSNGLDYEVSDYSFKSFVEVPDNAAGVESYEFSELDLETPITRENHKKVLRIEREFAQGNDFKISPVVLKHRGFSKVENDEKEKRIAEEVERRVAEIEKDAVERGFEEGVRKGQEEIYKQLKDSTEEKMSSFTAMLAEVLAQKAEIIETQKKDMFSIIKDLTKWIILRELKDDGEYIHRLLEKLVLEIQTKDNLLIKVNKQSFEMMPEVLEFVQAKLGHLKNVRVEIDYDLEQKGIILESENGIINADLEVQFHSLAELFTSVGVENEVGE